MSGIAVCVTLIFFRRLFFYSEWQQPALPAVPSPAHSLTFFSVSSPSSIHRSLRHKRTAASSFLNLTAEAGLTRRLHTIILGFTRQPVSSPAAPPATHPAIHAQSV